MNQEQYLTVRDVSHRLSIGKSTVWAWTQSEKFPQPIRLSSRCTRWRLSDVLNWEKGKISLGTWSRVVEYRAGAFLHQLVVICIGLLSVWTQSKRRIVSLVNWRLAHNLSITILVCARSYRVTAILLSRVYAMNSMSNVYLGRTSMAQSNTISVWY